MVLALGLSSCNIDEPAPKATPKTFDEYKAQLRKFVNSEKLFVDSSKVGYNINEFAPLSSTSYAAYKAYTPWLRGLGFRTWAKPLAHASSTAADLLLQD